MMMNMTTIVSTMNLLIISDGDEMLFPLLLW